MARYFVVVIVLLFTGIHSRTLQAQITPNGFVGAEGGMNFYFAEGIKKDFMRSKASAYYYNPSAGVSGFIQKNYTGLKYEHRLLKNRVGLLTGLRYSRLYSSIGKSGITEGNSGYFYVQVPQDGSDTRYLRVKEINQVTDYLGVPLEFRFFVSRARRVRFYVKAGMECNFRVAFNEEVVFQDAAMSPNEKWILDQVDEPAAIFGSGFLSPGVRFFPDKYPGINLEVHIISFIYPNHAVGLLTADAGAGFQLNIQVPLTIFNHAENQ